MKNMKIHDFNFLMRLSHATIAETTIFMTTIRNGFTDVI